MIGEELYDAASKGEVAKFQQLLQQQQDTFIIERVSYPYSRNLLHIATLRGQVAIVEEVLKINTELALDVDSKSSSSLHIAAAKGNVEIAKRLLSVAPDMCWCRDNQGMNPVHVAAMKGHVEILEVLLEVDHLPAMERVRRGQTVMHLCVKHCQLRALEFLAEKLRDLVHVKDDDGETLLHWAVRSKHFEMVRYLVKNFKEMKQSTNSKGATAYEIFMIKTRVFLDSDRAINAITEPQASSFWSDPETLKILSKKREQTMVVMTLIATMAFQAAVSPPGGVWQDDTVSHRAGEAVIAYTHPNIYKHLISANTIAFVSSLITIFLVAVQERIGKGFLLVFSSYVMWVSLASIAVSYGGSVLVIAQNTQTQSLTKIINIVVVVSVGIIGIKLLWNIVKQRRQLLQLTCTICQMFCCVYNGLENVEDETEVI